MIRQCGGYENHIISVKIYSVHCLQPALHTTTCYEQYRGIIIAIAYIVLCILTDLYACVCIAALVYYAEDECTFLGTLRGCLGAKGGSRALAPLKAAAAGKAV